MCQFSLPFTGDPETLLRRARQEIQGAGGAFTGDSMQGTFQAKTPLGSIQGSYQIAGQQIFLSILKKPFLLSCRRIETELAGVMY